jgi:trans-aconitate methyltransferase
MNNVTDSWKNKNVFMKQLDLNLKELSNKNYPEHWLAFIQHIKTENPNSILDIGCGCGAYYELCKVEFPLLKYTGVDYSEDAITIASNKWAYSEFFVRDYKELTPEYVKQFDLIHLGALLDVLPNGDEALEFILSLEAKNVLIGRMKITDKPSYFETYTAYDEITTYAYYHNKSNFLDLCKKYHYIVKNINNNFYLVKHE